MPTHCPGGSDLQMTSSNLGAGQAGSRSIVDGHRPRRPLAPQTCPDLDFTGVDPITRTYLNVLQLNNEVGQRAAVLGIELILKHVLDFKAWLCKVLRGFTTGPVVKTSMMAGAQDRSPTLGTTELELTLCAAHPPTRRLSASLLAQVSAPPILTSFQCPTDHQCVARCNPPCVPLATGGLPSTSLVSNSPAWGPHLYMSPGIGPQAHPCLLLHPRFQ